MGPPIRYVVNSSRWERVFLHIYCSYDWWRREMEGWVWASYSWNILHMWNVWDHWDILLSYHYKKRRPFRRTHTGGLTENAYTKRTSAFWVQTPKWSAVKFGAHFPPFFPRFPTGVLGTPKRRYAYFIKKKRRLTFFIFFPGKTWIGVLIKTLIGDLIIIKSHTGVLQNAYMLF